MASKDGDLAFKGCHFMFYTFLNVRYIYDTACITFMLDFVGLCWQLFLIF